MNYLIDFISDIKKTILDFSEILTLKIKSQYYQYYYSLNH